MSATSPAGGSLPAVTIRERRAVHREEDAYCAHPHMAVAAGGDWLLVFNRVPRRSIVLHPPEDPDYRNVMMRSADEGRTWRMVGVVPDYDWSGVECAGLTVTRSGRVILNQWRFEWLPLGLAETSGRDDLTWPAALMADLEGSPELDDFTAGAAGDAARRYPWARGGGLTVVHLSDDGGRSFPRTREIDTRAVGSGQRAVGGEGTAVGNRQSAVGSGGGSTAIGSRQSAVGGGLKAGGGLDAAAADTVNTDAVDAAAAAGGRVRSGVVGARAEGGRQWAIGESTDRGGGGSVVVGSTAAGDRLSAVGHEPRDAAGGSPDAAADTVNTDAVDAAGGGPDAAAADTANTDAVGAAAAGTVDATPGGYSGGYGMRGAVETADGTLVLPLTDVPNYRRLFVVRSRDGGETWSAPIPVAEGPGHAFEEPAPLVLASGRILMLLRDNDRRILHAVHSDDDGLSWSAPVATGIAGYPAHLLHLPDGRIAAVVGQRHPPYGIALHLADPDGTTFGPAIPLVTDCPTKDLGYPTAAVRQNGELVVVYYARGTDGVTGIECVVVGV